MKRFILTATILLAAGFSSAAQAQDFKPYAGVGIGAFGIEEKEPGFAQKNTVFGGYGKFGVDFNDYLGAEVRVGTIGSGKNTYPAGTNIGGTIVPLPTEVKLTADYFFSYLAKLQYPVAQDFRLYAMLGGTTAKAKATVTMGAVSANTSASKTGFSYGFGGEMFINEKMSIGGEWMQYWTDVNLSPVSQARLWGIAGTLTAHF